MAKWELDETYDPTSRPGYATVVPVRPQPAPAVPAPAAPAPTAPYSSPLESVPGPVSALSILMRAAGALPSQTPPAPTMPAPAPAALAIEPPAIPWGQEPPGPSMDVDRPATPPPVNGDLFGRFLRGMMDVNPATSHLPPEIKDRGAAIFRLFADRAWRDNSGFGAIVSNVEAGEGINTAPKTVTYTDHTGRVRTEQAGGDIYGMSYTPQEYAANAAEKERKSIAYRQNAAEKRDQERALGPLSPWEQAAAMLSSLFGSALSPEIAIGPAAAAYKTAGVGGKMALGAGANAAVTGIVDPIAQAAAVQRGDRREYSPAEHALATGGAAALGALIPALGALFRRVGALREAPPRVEAPPEAARAEAPPARPADPVILPSEKVGQPPQEAPPVLMRTDKAEITQPPGQPKAEAPPSVTEGRRLVDESLRRMDERVGAPPKAATEPAIAEAPRAVEPAPKAVEPPVPTRVEPPAEAVKPTVANPSQTGFTEAFGSLKGGVIGDNFIESIIERAKAGRLTGPFAADPVARRLKPEIEAGRVSTIAEAKAFLEAKLSPAPARAPVDKVDAPRESARMETQAQVDAEFKRLSTPPKQGFTGGFHHGSFEEGRAAGKMEAPDKPARNPYRSTVETVEREYASSWESGYVKGKAERAVEPQPAPTRAAEQPPDIPDFMKRAPAKEKPSEPVTPPAEAPRTVEAPQRASVEAVPARGDAGASVRQAEATRVEPPKAAEVPASAAAEPKRVEPQVGKEATYEGRKEIEFRAPFGSEHPMEAKYVVQSEKGAKATEEKWTVERRTGEYKYGRPIGHTLTPNLTKKEALAFARKAVQEELDANGRSDFTPTKYTSDKYVKVGDPVLFQHGNDQWRLGRAGEVNHNGVVVRADVGDQKYRLTQGQSFRMGEELRSGYEALLKRHGEKTWADPKDARATLQKWKEATLKAKETPKAEVSGNIKPEPVSGNAHPFTDPAAKTTEFNASLGLTPALAKSVGPELVGAAVGGLVDHWETHGRFGFSPRGAVMGALAVAALRHRLPGLSRAVVGKDSLATAGLKALGDAAANTRLGRQFHPTMGVERELWDKLVKLKVETRNFQDDALKIAKHIRENTTPEERIAISDWIERRDLSEHGINSWEKADAKVQGMADALSAHVDGLGERLVKVGMLDDAAFQKLRGEYLHRYYLPKLAADDGFKQKAARMKASASYALRRGESVENAPFAEGLKVGDQAVQWTHAKNGAVEYHPIGKSPGDEWFSSKTFKVERVDAEAKKMDLHRDYTPQERQRMGEIRDANFRFAMGSMEASRDLALGTMFKDLSENQKWSNARDPGGWVKVPTTAVGQGSEIKKYGLLAGRWVSPETWDALKITRKPWSPDELGFGAGIMNGYLKALGLWKVGKTAYNPATHFNNVMGNVSLSALTGEVGPTHLMKAIGAFKRKDAVIEEARRAGLSLDREANLGDTFDGVRVDVGMASGMDVRSGWSKFMDWYTNNAIVRAYQHEDAIFKLGAYMKRRAAGETPESAVANVHKVFFDYGDVPLGVQAVRDFYSPFFTYTYKYAQVMMRELAERPHRFLAAFGALSAIDMMSYDWLYGDRAKAVSDYEREMMPTWLKGRSGFGAQKAIRLPWNEKDQQTGENRAMMLNTRYVIPGGDVLDFVANGNFGPTIYPQALGNTILGGNPLLNFAYGLATGKDSYFNKSLYPYPDTGLLDFGKRPAGEIVANWGAAIRFAATQALPPTLISAPDKIGQAAVGEGAIPKGSQAAEFFGWTGTDYAGRQKSIARAVSSVLGVKIEDVAPDEAKKFREAELAKEVRDNMHNARNLHRNQTTTETRKENAKESAMDRIQRFRDETRKMRDLQEKAGAR